MYRPPPLLCRDRKMQDKLESIKLNYISTRLVSITMWMYMCNIDKLFDWAVLMDDFTSARLTFDVASRHSRIIEYPKSARTRRDPNIRTRALFRDNIVDIYDNGYRFLDQRKETWNLRTFKSLSAAHHADNPLAEIECVTICALSPSRTCLAELFLDSTYKWAYIYILHVRVQLSLCTHAATSRVR